MSSIVSWFYRLPIASARPIAPYSEEPTTISFEATRRSRGFICSCVAILPRAALASVYASLSPIKNPVSWVCLRSSSLAPMSVPAPLQSCEKHTTSDVDGLVSHVLGVAPTTELTISLLLELLVAKLSGSKAQVTMFDAALNPAALNGAGEEEMLSAVTDVIGETARTKASAQTRPDGFLLLGCITVSHRSR